MTGFHHIKFFHIFWLFLFQQTKQFVLYLFLLCNKVPVFQTLFEMKQENIGKKINVALMNFGALKRQTNHTSN